jgi:hypothetical protein
LATISDGEAARAVKWSVVLVLRRVQVVPSGEVKINPESPIATNWPPVHTASFSVLNPAGTL